MSNATAPPPSLTCPDWCTSCHNDDATPPEDRSHLHEPKLPEFVAIGHDPRLFVEQYAHETEPKFMFELNIYPEDVMDRSGAVGYYREMAAAFLTLAERTEREWIA